MGNNKGISRRPGSLAAVILAALLAAGSFTAVMASAGTGVWAGSSDQTAEQTSSAESNNEAGTAADAAAALTTTDSAAVSADAEAEQPAEPVYTKGKKITIGSYDLTFTTKVIKEKRLTGKKYTNTLQAAGKRSYIKLTWDPVANVSNISGYLILRRDNADGRWHQIAAVGRSKTAYKDKEASEKNTFYQYTMVSYAETSYGRMISKPADWAGAVTSKSSGGNVTDITLENRASVSAVSTGGRIQAEIEYPSNPYTKDLRWTSANKKVAKVTSKGVIKGVSLGKTTIRARTHTGAVLEIPVTVFEPGTAQSMIDVMESWYGFSYYNGGNKSIVDIYNSVLPHPRGYTLKYWDAWCAASITAAAIRTGNEAVIGRECSCDKFITIFKSKKIWIENEEQTPQKGDIIIYTWTGSQNMSSHIGLVTEVNGNYFTVIEGNKGIGEVGYRTVKVGWKYIRGFARPHYPAD